MRFEIPSQFNIASHFVDRPAQEHPDRMAIVGEPAPVTYGELGAQVNRAANALRATACRPGDRVLILLPDSTEFVAAFFGAAKIGAIAVPVNPMTRTADYAYYLRDSGARAGIVHELALSEFLPAEQPNPLQALVVVGSAERARISRQTLRWTDWLSAAPATAVAHPTAATDPAFFLYTSGSGGTPKAAVHEHKDMLVTSRTFAEGVLGLCADDRTFSVSKLFFAYGLGNGMYFPFSVGASTVFDPERPRPERVLGLLARHRPTVFFSVPTFYAALLRAAADGVPADFTSVRLAVSAGEALPAEIFLQCRKEFGLEIIDAIGSTEMLHMFISNRPGRARPASCGTVLPGYAARIVDDAGREVPVGEMGNLWIRGQSAFSSYWNKPELTARTKLGDWVVTGDKFTRDAEGFFHYCGRSDDMMKVSGMWVSPGEVENALLGHPGVAEAAVVGLADTAGLLRPVAYVVTRPGTAPGHEEIRSHLRARLAGYKCPAEIRFVAELPKTATGKIQRFRLRENP